MKQSRLKSGFTLIEMIVSLALFSVVVTIAVGAFLILLATNKQLQEEQSILTNLSFALDSMTREIRTGSAYFCDGRNNLNGNGNPFRDGNELDNIHDLEDVNDCPNGRTRDVWGVSFVEGGDSITGSGSNRIIYFYDADSQALYRRISDQVAQKITSDGVLITDADFIVTGSETLAPGETDQPAVTIYIEATSAPSGGKTYPIQTTVVQRTLDL